MYYFRYRWTVNISKDVKVLQYANKFITSYRIQYNASIYQSRLIWTRENNDMI